MSSKKIKISGVEAGTLQSNVDLNVQGTLTIGTEVITNNKFASKFIGNESSGRQEYTTAGNYTFVVPEGVVKISALAIGAGGGGAQTWANNGSAGGGLAWADNIEVTAGDSISITVPGITSPNTDGGDAVVGSFFTATGGGSGNQSRGWQPGTYVSGSVSASGGTGGRAYDNASWQGGGGGAAGYSGNGGNGYYGGNGTSPYNGAGGGGAGGGGYASSTYGFGGGGGVGISGEGSSGTWGTLNSQTSSPQNNGNSFYGDDRYVGAGGSGGENGGRNNNSNHTSNLGNTIYHGQGGRYGGGGAGAGSSQSNNGNFGRGGQGAVVIAWSTSDSFSIA